MSKNATRENEATQHVLDWVFENTEPSVDGAQNAHAAVWQGEQNLKAQARKNRIAFDVGELDAALAELKEAGEVVTWHGLVAPATDEHLQTIVENEAQSEIVRERLIAKCNALRAGQEVSSS